MFGFGKKKRRNEESDDNRSMDKKGESRTDKLVMGAIIGVAVGSVVGISLKGKNEHEQKKERAKINGASFKETMEPRSRLGRMLKRLFGKKESKKPVHHGQTIKKIPNEWE